MKYLSLNFYLNIVRAVSQKMKFMYFYTNKGERNSPRILIFKWMLIIHFDLSPQQVSNSKLLFKSFGKFSRKRSFYFFMNEGQGVNQKEQTSLKITQIYQTKNPPTRNLYLNHVSSFGEIKVSIFLINELEVVNHRMLISLKIQISQINLSSQKTTNAKFIFKQFREFP